MDSGWYRCGGACDDVHVPKRVAIKCHLVWCSVTAWARGSGRMIHQTLAQDRQFFILRVVGCSASNHSDVPIHLLNQISNLQSWRKNKWFYCWPLSLCILKPVKLKKKKLKYKTPNPKTNFILRSRNNFSNFYNQILPVKYLTPPRKY